MMFPQINIEEQAEETTNIGTSFKFDFEKGDFILENGKLVKVEDLEALKIWINKVLRTEKFRFEIYKDIDYGVTLEDLIGQTLPRKFVESELKREISEALTKHSMIDNVSNIMTERDGSKLIINFQVNLTDGNSLEVTI